MAQVNYSENGLVYITKSTFSAVSSVSIDNCFSADYSQYKIILDSSFTDSQALYTRLRASGTDNSTNNYADQFINADSTTISGNRRTAQSLWINFPFHMRTDKSIGISEILNPFQSTYTFAFKADGEAASGTSIQLQIASYAFNGTDSFDGFSLITHVGTMTGTVYVYGYVES
jgi:hypothetical protein